MSKAPAADTAPPHHHPAKGRGRRRKVGAIIKPSASPSELRKTATHGVWTAGSSQSPVRWGGNAVPGLDSLGIGARMHGPKAEEIERLLLWLVAVSGAS
jgi:hypothetical protein